ncbi:hypothetical protein [Ligilactobacillus aviarius]|uniref:hypothetical protein n=1 Tax=Ligilactobacillus aviarius TaxID=1606 RepID=UPI0024BABDF5|nr:hypothetical protein [Ligilactobacillus aviarius]
MEELIYINGNNHVSATKLLIDMPEYCPLCGKDMIPKVFPNAILSDVSVGQSLRYEVGFFARCTHCNKIFENIFYIRYGANGNLEKSAVFQSVKNPNIGIEVPKNICELSSRFFKVYTQALQAEKLNLNELVGMGLRKALEFLAKDFAIKLNPDNTEKIEKMPLSQVINNELSNSLEDISILLKNATWLGNDETHYIKKFPDKDISDMKRYISAAIKLIDSKLEVIKLKEEMQQN